MKLVKVFALFIVCVLWLGGCYHPVMHLLYQTRIIADDYRYGDLYRLSNLPQFKDPITRCPSNKVAADTAHTHLYVIGDSFTEPERLSKPDLPVSYFRSVKWENKDTIQLDPTAYNVLLIESVERHFREHAAPKLITAKSTAPTDNLLVVSDTTRTSNLETASWGQQLVDIIHSKGIEERLEAVLFSQDIFLWLKELKATLTFTAFDRVSPTVSLSKNKEHIFTALDTDSTKRYNAGTSPLPEQEAAALVRTINETAEHYKSVGFDKVILSIIPNKSTLLDPDPAYNHLVERIQNYPGLNVPIVDVYSLYRKQDKSVYALGDSHWNCNGRRIWLEAVTKQLAQKQQ